MATSNSRFGGASTNSSNGFAAGGGPTSPTSKSATEEFVVTTSTVTGAAWASGGNLGTARRYLAGAGTQTAALAFGGFGASGSGGEDSSESYNGSSWTEVGDLNTSRYGLVGIGTQTAALTAGGTSASISYTDKAESWDGSSWSNITDMPGNKDSATGTGTQTANLVTGGYNGSAWIYTTIGWNGSSWSSKGNIPTGNGNQYASLAGTQTSALIAFGNVISSPSVPDGEKNTTAIYNGTAWTAISATVNDVRTGAAGWGQSSDSVTVTGGNGSPYITTGTEVYDGTSWVSGISMATARQNIANARGTAAPSSVGIVFGGKTNTHVALTEEFTGETVAVNAAKSIDFD